MEKTLGKEIRHQGTKTGWSLIGYFLITNLCVLVAMFLDMVGRMLEKSGGDVPSLSVTDIEVILNESLEHLMTYGTVSIIACLLGIPILMIVFRKNITIINMWETKKKMTLSNFFMLLSVFMAGQLVFNFVGIGIEALLNTLGYSATQQLEWVSSTSETLSMFLYISIIGPIAEEIIYRGYVMRNLTRYGKHFAIVCSSIIFGIMHANIYQIPFAMVVGLVLGYVASEFSLKWAVVLHIVNNCIFSELMGRLVANFPETTQAIIQYAMLGAFFVAALLVMWKHRHDIKNYYQENKVNMKQYVKFFVSVGMIIYIAIEVLMTISGITPIQ